MFSYKSIYFVIFTLILYKCDAEISDKRLCVDENCSVLVAHGKTLLRYSSIDKNVLSFGPNEDVKVFSLPAGSNPELVGVEINGKRGYINKAHFRETTRVKRPTILVDTEVVKDKPEAPAKDVTIDIIANPTLQAYEIVDGTQLPVDVISSSTEAPVVNVNQQKSEENSLPLNSAVPNNQKNKPDSLNTEENKGVKSQAQQKQPFALNNQENKNFASVPQSLNEAVSSVPKDDLNIGEDKVEDANMKENDDTEDGDDNDDDEDDDDDVEEEIIIDDESDEDKEETKPKNKNKVPLETSFFANSAVNRPSSKKNNDKSDVSVQDQIGLLSNNTKKDYNEAKLKESDKENDGNQTANQQPTPDHGFTSNHLEGLEVANNTEQTQSLPSPNSETSNTDKLAIPTPAPEELVPIINNTNSPEVENSTTHLPAEHMDTSTESISTEKVRDNEQSNASVEVNVDDTKEHNNIPATSTELPIEIEVAAPTDFDIVTPNPLGDKNTNSLIQDSKNDTDANQHVNPSLPSDKESETKDFKEEAKEKNNEQANNGWFNFGGIFKAGEEQKDHEESSSKNNEDLEYSVDASELASDPTFSNEPLYKVNDEASEDIVENVQSSVESVPVNTNQDLYQVLNSEIQKPKNDAEVKANKNVEETEKTESVDTEKSPSQEESSGGLFANFPSLFGSKNSNEDVKTNEDNKEITKEAVLSSYNNFEAEASELDKKEDTKTDTPNPWNNVVENTQSNDFCDKESQDCPKDQEQSRDTVSRSNSLDIGELQILFLEAFSSDMLLYLVTTALSVILLVFGMVILDKCRREGPLIGRINKLEQQLLITMKENEMLQKKTTSFVEEKTQLVIESVPNEVVEDLKQKLCEMEQVKLALEEQIIALEKELDTSTEVGIELNKIITEMLNSTDGNETIKENIEQMQKKLFEQQDTINSVNETLSLKETENHELRLEMEISNRKVVDLQSELDKMVEKMLKIEEERDQQHGILEQEILLYKTKSKEALTKEHKLNSEIQTLKEQVKKLQRVAEVKVKEYNILKESLNEIKSVKNNKEVLRSLLEVSEIKAQLEQVKTENLQYTEQLAQERESNSAFGTKIEILTQEVSELREKYQKSDKEKVEINTKLQVLNNYFKEKEDQMQKEISKYESLWAVKEGEATSTTERIKYMQEELQNYKAQNESLKQEIVNQEVELKSQISMLEKKAHESWVANRQTERKLEEAKQEAAQLRNRLTLRERAIAEGMNQTRMQSPLHQNGELPISPPPLDPTQSPPPIFNPRDAPIPGMPPPFLPPPLGATPFMPPPPLDGMMPPPLGDMGGMPPFMPPLPPGVYPGDHRPPPLGRMSSPPPVGGRYTPESTVYSDYDRYSRRSQSPPYDSEYAPSPPPIRGYSPYQDRLRDDRREYKRPQARSNGRNSKGIHSSGSENDSLGKLNKKPQRKV